MSYKPGTTVSKEGVYEELDPRGSPLDPPRTITLSDPPKPLPPTRGKGHRWRLQSSVISEKRSDAARRAGVAGEIDFAHDPLEAYLASPLDSATRAVRRHILYATGIFIALGVSRKLILPGLGLELDVSAAPISVLLILMIGAALYLLLELRAHRQESITRWRETHLRKHEQFIQDAIEQAPELRDRMDAEYARHAGEGAETGIGELSTRLCELERKRQASIKERDAVDEERARLGGDRKRFESERDQVEAARMAAGVEREQIQDEARKLAADLGLATPDPSAPLPHASRLVLGARRGWAKLRRASVRSQLFAQLDSALERKRRTERKLTELEHTRDSLDRRLANLGRDLSRLTGELEARDREIATLEAQIAKRGNTLQSLRKDLENLKTAGWKGDITALDDLFKKASLEAAARHQEIFRKSLSALIEDCQHRRHGLNDSVSRLLAYLTRVQKMHESYLRSSTSGRSGKPTTPLTRASLPAAFSGVALLASLSVPIGLYGDDALCILYSAGGVLDDGLESERTCPAPLPESNPIALGPAITYAAKRLDTNLAARGQASARLLEQIHDRTAKRAREISDVVSGVGKQLHAQNSLLSGLLAGTGKQPEARISLTLAPSRPPRPAPVGALSRGSHLTLTFPVFPVGSSTPSGAAATWFRETIQSLAEYANRCGPDTWLHVVGYPDGSCFANGCDAQSEARNIALANARARFAREAIRKAIRTAIARAPASTGPDDAGSRGAGARVTLRQWRGAQCGSRTGTETGTGCESEFPIMMYRAGFDDGTYDNDVPAAAGLNRRIDLEILNGGECSRETFVRALLERERTPSRLPAPDEKQATPAPSELAGEPLARASNRGRYRF